MEVQLNCIWILALLLLAVWSWESYLASLTPNLLCEQGPKKGCVRVWWAGHTTLGATPVGPHSLSLLVLSKMMSEGKAFAPKPSATLGHLRHCTESSFAEPGETRSAFCRAAERLSGVGSRLDNQLLKAMGWLTELWGIVGLDLECVPNVFDWDLGMPGGVCGDNVVLKKELFCLTSGGRIMPKADGSPTWQEE